jgi:hypothetical protein
MGYNVKISNNRYSELVYADQMYELTLVETIGNLLPMFKLSFRDNDFEKLHYLNELNPITISYQIDDNIISGHFIIKQKKPIITGTTFDCSIGGYLNKFEYFKGVPKVPFIQGTSVEAITQLASAYFETQIVDIVTEDKMNWIHNGKNARNFMQEIWTHCYSPNNFLMLGIGLDGIFRLTDILTLVSQEPKYRFANSMQEGYELYVNAWVDDDSLQNTSLFGYTSERDILMEGSLETLQSSFTPQVVLNTSNQLNEQPDIPTRKLAPMFQPENVHKYWYQAHHQNLVRWSSLNNNTIHIVTYNNLLPLNIMDLVYADLPEVGNTGKSADGNYIIARKELSFDGSGNLTTTYTGIREVAQNTALAPEQEENSTYGITAYRI